MPLYAHPFVILQPSKNRHSLFRLSIHGQASYFRPIICQLLSQILVVRRSPYALLTADKQCVLRPPYKGYDGRDMRVLRPSNNNLYYWKPKPLPFQTKSHRPKREKQKNPNLQSTNNKHKHNSKQVKNTTEKTNNLFGGYEKTMYLCNRNSRKAFLKDFSTLQQMLMRP